MMQIHSVILITQLKSVNKKDLYNHQRDVNLSLVKNNEITDEIENINVFSTYKIEQLLNKHTTHHRCSQSTIEYLIK